MFNVYPVYGIRKRPQNSAIIITIYWHNSLVNNPIYLKTCSCNSAVGMCFLAYLLNLYWRYLKMFKCTPGHCVFKNFHQLKNKFWANKRRTPFNNKTFFQKFIFLWHNVLGNNSCFCFENQTNPIADNEIVINFNSIFLQTKIQNTFLKLLFWKVLNLQLYFVCTVVFKQ